MSVLDYLMQVKQVPCWDRTPAIKDDEIDELIRQESGESCKIELTFPDCPTCSNMSNGKCPYADKCKVVSVGDERHGIPTHWCEVMQFDHTKLCKGCGNIASWNSYFGGWYCSFCGVIDRPKNGR